MVTSSNKLLLTTVVKDSTMSKLLRTEVRGLVHRHWVTRVVVFGFIKSVQTLEEAYR